jgi:hypothetical protein
MNQFSKIIALTLLSLGVAWPACADTVLYNNDTPNFLIGTASRPNSGSGERETADDFVLTTGASLTGAAFTGLIPENVSIKSVVVEIYRVFPNDSDVGRTSGPPTFSTPNVPTRVNSPSDVEFADRKSGTNLTFIPTPLADNVTVAKSIVNNIKVGGPSEGPVTGQEVRFNVLFTTPIDLPADHYFFVPQVELSTGDFLWLSANRPVPFPPGFTDLQTWIRNDPGIAPDWLRVGTDVIGGNPAPTFNASFLVFGNAVPEPSTWAMVLLGFVGLGFAFRQSRRKASLA